MQGKVKDIIKMLQERHDQEEVLLMPLWSVDDVLSLDNSLSQEEAKRVLFLSSRHHNAEIGVNWDSLQSDIETVKQERVCAK